MLHRLFVACIAIHRHYTTRFRDEAEPISRVTSEVPLVLHRSLTVYARAGRELRQIAGQELAHPGSAEEL